MHFPLEANYIGLEMIEMTLLRNVFFWSFLTKTKQDKLLPSGIHAKISPKAPILGYDFGPIIMLATFCLRHPVYYIKAYGNWEPYIDPESRMNSV